MVIVAECQILLIGQKLFGLVLAGIGCVNEKRFQIGKKDLTLCFGMFLLDLGNLLINKLLFFSRPGHQVHHKACIWRGHTNGGWVVVKESSISFVSLIILKPNPQSSGNRLHYL